MLQRLWRHKNRLKAGIHPDDNKHLSNTQAIQVLPIPQKLYFPLRQHLGDPCVPVVAVKDSVKKGQVIAEPPHDRVPPIHASTSGTVVAIGNFPEVSSGMAMCIVIEPDGLDQWAETVLQTRNYTELTVKELLKIIRDNGLVGMGGAAFPTHVKLNPPQDKTISWLIVNAAECEPYLTADARLMVESAADIVRGCQIVMKILNVEKCSIGIEDNKPESIAVMRKAVSGTAIKIVVLHTQYPQGAEKMLIKSVTGLEIAPGKLPMDIGCAVQNIATLIAIAQAVEKNIPLIQRVLTVSGKAIRDPKNLLVRLGTPMQAAIDFCSGFTDPPEKIVMGGPMMGTAISDTQAPIVKSTSGIIAFTKKEVLVGKERPCISCGKCVAVCSIGLRPNILCSLSKKGKHKTALVEYHLLECMECGCCTYVCPAKQNIGHQIKLSKALGRK